MKAAYQKKATASSKCSPNVHSVRAQPFDRERQTKITQALSENRIMDMHDDGQSIRDIAAALNLQPNHVKVVINRMSAGNELRRRVTAAQRSSNMLLAALRLHHPELFGGAAQ